MFGSASSAVSCLYLSIFSPPPFSPATPRTRRSGHGELLRSPGSWLSLQPPSSVVFRGWFLSFYLQIHRFSLLSSPFHCRAHRLGLFLSLLYSIHTLSEYTIVYLFCPCTPELFQVFSSYELGCYTRYFVGISLTFLLDKYLLMVKENICLIL